MRRIEIFRLCLVVLATTAVCRGFDGAVESQTANPRSDDPRVRWETERSRWDDRRRAWDTDPLTFTIAMPDYHHTTRGTWRQQSNAVWSGVAGVADEALYWASDERLSVEQRCDILAVVEQFSAKMTGEKLTKIIDLVDERGMHFSDIPRGQYPIVTVLKNYGRPVATYVMFALGDETDPLRRRLLCDVLLDVLVGETAATAELTKEFADRDLTPEQSKNLKLALEELQRPRTEE